MGVDAKLLNKKTGDKIYIDRYYNLQNNYTHYFDEANKLSGDGMERDELVELCDDLITLSHLSTEMLIDIRDNVKKLNKEDRFIIIDENNDKY